MKPTYRSLYLQIVAILLALSFGLHAYAETPREELVHVYRLLKTANHDYDGHRIKAMNEVAAAGRELGLRLEGDLPDRERQWASDVQLNEAHKLLRSASVTLEQQDRDRVIAHVNKALNEITAALSVK